ncbi:MAG: PDZ domain-containing protein [Deltaproteobacteria bacterium]|nr:PDZ domain-containing protein [Deltaproteobacteria bacterium]MBN2844457.1 PDZ domain-containing protein [Deltaproteobacteria bacterium]
MLKSVFKTILIIFLFLLAACVQLETVRESVAVKSRTQPFLGIGYRIVTGLEQIPGMKAPHGISVARVVSGSSAEKAGIRVNDIIIAYDSINLEKQKESEVLQAFSDYIKKQKAIGDEMTLRIIRTETAIEGRSNETDLSIANLADLERLFDDQKPGEVFDFSVEKKVHLIDIVATLRERESFTAEPPPENSLLFPEYETLTDPYSDLAKELIDAFDIEDAYQDILKRYGDDELEYDAFRLNLFRYIHRDPLKFSPVAEMVSGELEAIGKENDLPAIIDYGARLIDEPPADAGETIECPTSKEPEVHLSFIRDIVLRALDLRNRAIETLDQEEREFLLKNLSSFIDDGFESDSSDSENKAEKIRKTLRLLKKINYGALFKSAKILSQLTDAEWLSDFEQLMIDYPSPQPVTIQGISGTILFAEETEAGLIVIGGRTANRYEREAAVLIDLGGNDFYGGNPASASGDRPLSIIVDFSGNDEYSATENFAEGAGILGTGILLDLAGDDIYHGVAFSQGVGIAGIGILADRGGNDEYFGQKYNQGVGFWGMGLLLDSGGEDSYRSHLFAQGVGGPKGVGLLLDNSGDDSYYATGKEPSSYSTPGIFRGYSQGFGIGFRHHASGGIGILIDSAGHDRFRAGNFSQGGGYYFGLGILKNSGNEDDEYIASRYGQGFSAHSAAGILIDEGGSDHYSGSVGALQGAAWDLGIAALLDRSGNDTYESAGLFFSQGAAAHNGFSFFIDSAGEDRYLFEEEEKVSKNTYHGGYSLSFVIDDGGDVDSYNESRDGNDQIQLGGEYRFRADLDRTVEEMLQKNSLRHLRVE